MYCESKSFQLFHFSQEAPLNLIPSWLFSVMHQSQTNSRPNMADLTHSGYVQTEAEFSLSVKWKICRHVLDRRPAYKSVRKEDGITDFINGTIK